MYLSGLQGQGTSACPAASGIPTLWTQGTTRFSALSITASASSPTRAMMRMLMTT